MAELIAPDGRTFRTNDPGTINRLTLSGGYKLAGAPEVPTVEDLQFHPTGKHVSDVLKYIEENPEERTRIIAEEKAGKNRPTIVGD